MHILNLELETVNQAPLTALWSLHHQWTKRHISWAAELDINTYVYIKLGAAMFLNVGRGATGACGRRTKYASQTRTMDPSDRLTSSGLATQHRTNPDIDIRADAKVKQE
jgi:hypothetical protein